MCKVTYSTKAYQNTLSLCSDYTSLPEINGESIDLNPEYVYKSPYLNGAFDDETVTISHNNKNLEMNLQSVSSTYTEGKSVQDSDDQVSIVNDLVIYPNPILGKEFYIGSEFEASSYSIFLPVSTGKVIKSGSVNLGTVNIDDVPNGVYLLKVLSTDQRVHHAKIIVK